MHEEIFEINLTLSGHIGVVGIDVFVADTKKQESRNGYLDETACVGLCYRVILSCMKVRRMLF